VIDRRMAGQGLGARLLEWAELRARTAGRPFLRLDCLETNDRLRRYYRDRGFSEAGRCDPSNGW
jgi:GNAT superfamily N-acetyltransferase